MGRAYADSSASVVPTVPRALRANIRPLQKMRIGPLQFAFCELGLIHAENDNLDIEFAQDKQR